MWCALNGFSSVSGRDANALIYAVSLDKSTAEGKRSPSKLAAAGLGGTRLAKQQMN